MDNKNTLLNNINTLNGEGIDVNALPTYERVTWENGAGPAINADNLNRIEEALEALLGSNETSGIVQDFSIQINTDGKNIKSLSENKVDKTTVAKKDSLGLVKSGGDVTVDTKGNVTVEHSSTADSASWIQTNKLDLSLGKTVANLRTQLATWIQNNYQRVGCACTFTMDLPILMDSWNNEDLNSEVSGETTNTAYLETYYGWTDYALIRFTCYSDKQVYYTTLQNGVWGPFRQVAFDNDLATKVDKTTTINNHALGENITLTKSDVGLDKVENKSSREILNELQSSDVLSVLPVATSSDLGAVRSGGDITVDTKGNVTVNKASTLTGLDATVAELNNIKGTTSPVQTQINNVSTNISSLSTELNTVKNSYVTKEYVDKKIDDVVIPEGGGVDLNNYYTKEEVDNKIPTKISAFTNDSNYMTTTEANNTFVSKTEPLTIICGTSTSI